MDHNWYNSLNKPSYTPPAIVFKIVWPILYLMMGVSFLIMITSNSQMNKSLPTVFFVSQLLINFSWPKIFFGMHKLKMGVAIICILIILVLLTIVSFYPISYISAGLLTPYLFWLLFAGFLNYKIVKLN